MQTFNDFPDLGKVFEKMKIEDKLFEKADPNTVLGFAIQKGLIDKSFPSVIKMIKDAAKDNFNLVLGVLKDDIDLLLNIQNLEL